MLVNASLKPVLWGEKRRSFDVYHFRGVNSPAVMPRYMWSWEDQLVLVSQLWSPLHSLTPHPL